MIRSTKGHVRIISPSSREDDEVLVPRLNDLSQRFEVSYHKLEADPSWPFTAGTVEDRFQQLMQAVRDPHARVILASRGGYGAADLLGHIPWNELAALPPKPIIGFSDVSALHSAFYTKLKWPGIHAPMPSSVHWGQHGREDIEALLSLLGESPQPIRLPLLFLGRGFAPRVEGWGFGGCLSVLSNLIGTPYLPQSLEGAVLYWEDVGEHPSRILRFIQQWELSGLLKGVAAIILGRFVGCETGDNCREVDLRHEIARRIKAPLWFCPLFGHCSPNWPLPIGLPLVADGQTLSWNLPAQVEKGSRV